MISSYKLNYKNKALVCEVHNTLFRSHMIKFEVISIAKFWRKICFVFAHILIFTDRLNPASLAASE
jgi:hypothetical protein